MQAKMKRYEELKNKKYLKMLETEELEDLKKELFPTETNSNERKSAIFNYTKTKDKLEYINIYKIEDNPYQPRVHFRENEVEELGDSIKEQGLAQAITVAKLDSKYYLIAGQKRLKAYKLLNKEEKDKDDFEQKYLSIPATIKEFKDIKEIQTLSLIENMIRTNPFHLDTANAIKRHYDSLKEENPNLTQREYLEIANKDFKLTLGTLNKYLQIANLPEEVKEKIVAKQYNKMTVMYEIAKTDLPIEEKCKMIEKDINPKPTPKQEKKQSAAQEPKKEKSILTEQKKRKETVIEAKKNEIIKYIQELKEQIKYKITIEEIEEKDIK